MGPLTRKGLIYRVIRRFANPRLSWSQFSCISRIYLTLIAYLKTTPTIFSLIGKQMQQAHHRLAETDAYSFSDFLYILDCRYGLLDYG